MFPVKLIRKFVKFIRGGAMPWQIAASCLVGVSIGMAPGFNLTVAILIAAFVLLNLNLGLMLLGLAAGKALCLALAPLTFRLGYFLIHDLGAEGLFRGLSEAPIFAWMDLHHYCLLGGIPVALLVGGGGGLVLGRMIAMARSAIAAGGEKSERFQRISRNGAVRLLLRLLFGKQRTGIADMLSAKPSMFRKAGVVVCIALVVVMVAAQFLLADRLARSGLVQGLQASTGAEVNVERVEFSALTGKVKVVGLQITDPAKPTHNMIQIDTLTSDVSVVDLMGRRIVMDEVLIDRLRTDAPRESKGEVFVEPDKADEPMSDQTVSEYFKDGRKVLEYLRKAQEYLDKRAESQQRHAEGETAPSPDELQRLARLQGYLKMTAQSVLAKRPLVTIRRLAIGEIPAGELDTYSLEGTNLSDSPELNDEPMKLALTSTRGMDASVTFDFSKIGALHRLHLVVPNVAVGEGGSIQLSSDKPVRVGAAKVDVSVDGTFGRDGVNLPVELTVRDLKADTSGKVLGMDAATANRVFKRLDSMSVVLTLHGPLAAPRVRIDQRETLASLTGALKEAGARELTRQVAKQLEGLGVDGVGDIQNIQTPQDVVDAANTIVSGLLKGTTTQPSAKGGEENPAADPVKALRGLLGQ